jgi:hypothetical protein
VVFTDEDTLSWSNADIANLRVGLNALVANRYSSYDHHSNYDWGYHSERRSCRSPYMCSQDI